MKIAIDASGRLVVPKPVRERLGVHGPTELELVEGDGQVLLRPLPSNVHMVEQDGVLVADRGAGATPLDWETVRDLVEHQRR